ncbi:hypothetical protein ACJX0J_028476, partial [Zea mays]
YELQSDYAKNSFELGNGHFRLLLRVMVVLGGKKFARRVSFLLNRVEGSCHILRNEDMGLFRLRGEKILVLQFGD